MTPFKTLWIKMSRSRMASDPHQGGVGGETEGRGGIVSQLLAVQPPGNGLQE